MIQRYLGAVLAGAAFVAQPTFAWKTEVLGTASGNEEANATVKNPAGDVYIAGQVSNTDTQTDFTVVKFSGTDGAILWGTSVNGSADLADEAFAIALGSDGHPVAAGVLNRTDTDRDFAILKFSSSTGAELWRAVFDGDGSDTVAEFDRALSVAVDASNDVVAAGQLRDSGGQFSDPPSDFFVIKVSGTTGDELWRYEKSGTNSFSDIATGVGVDATGDVFAVGHLQNSGTGDDLAVVKLDGSDGSELWLKQFDGTEAFEFDRGLALAIDANGDVAVVGNLENDGTESDYSVIVLEGNDGDLRWQKDLDGTATGFEDDDEARAVAFDGNGDVVTVGRLSNDGTESDFATIKFDGENGDVAWRREIDGSATGFSDFDRAHAVAVDSNNDVVSVGDISSEQSGTDFSVVKYRGTDGFELWRTDIEDNPVGFDSANDIVFGSPDPIVVGEIDSNLGVVKLVGDDGSDFTSGDPCGEDNDQDGVGDLCDNCMERFNPVLGTMGQPPRESHQTTTGGQLDDDADGFGNACDAKFEDGGQVVSGIDLAEHVASFNKDRSGNDCGTDGQKSCAQFDLDNAGQFIGGNDLVLGRQLFNSAPGPNCPNCPLACEGPAC